MPATLPHYVVVAGSGSGTLPVSSGGPLGQLQEEVPIGTYDGSNTVFALSQTPKPQKIWLIVNGVVLSRFASRDGALAAQYTLAGKTITFTVAPKATDYVWCLYFSGSGTGTTATGTRSGKARQFGVPDSGSLLGAGFAGAVGTFTGNTAEGIFSATAMNDGDTVTIAGITYTFRNAINNATPYEILANPHTSTFAPTLPSALVNAIKAGAGAGTVYSSATTAHPDVTASVLFDNDLGKSVALITGLQNATDNPVNLSSVSGGRFAWSVASVPSGAMVDGDTITIGATTYTFKDVLNNAVANQVLTKVPVTMQTVFTSVETMLITAIMHGFGAGIIYSSPTVKNTQVSASSITANTMSVVALAGGAAGNTIAISTSSGGRFSWSGSTLTGGSGGGTGTSSDQLNWGNKPNYAILGDLTIAFWIKIPSNSVALGSILQFTDGSAAGNTGWTNYAAHVNGSSGAWSIHYGHQYATASDETHDFSTNIPNDTWKFIALVRDATGKTVTCYTGDVGGTSVSNAGTFTYTNAPAGGSAASLVLGFALGHGDSFNLVGTIEEHYVYSRQLSTDELAAALGGNPTLDAMELGCFMGDTPEIDLTGNGGSATITGTTIVQGHS